MVRTSLVLAALTLSAPGGCSALLDRARAGARPKDSATAPAATGTTVAAKSSAAPVRTAPPVWMPPGPPVDLPPPTDPNAEKPLSAEMKKALEAFEAGEHKKVKTLLEKRVRGGKGTVDEAKLLAASCTSLKDKPCTEAANAAASGP